MDIRIFFLIFLSGCACNLQCGSNPYMEDSGPLVRTSSGAVMGKYENVFDTEVAAFLGIPYAEPPINEKRFQQPTPKGRWNGIFEATKKPNPCMQYSSRVFDWIPTSITPSEDCLYLNVWLSAKCCCTAEDKLPVLVWIHGGGFYSGATNMPVYDGSTLAAYSKAIVVTFNYRLGIFGFLNSGNDRAPGNAGLLDQNLALKWVKNNIKYFGGDENAITLMGESAGAVSVSLHMVSPLSKGLFNRAILQSATAYHPQMVDSPEVSYGKSTMFAKLAGCVSNSSTKGSHSNFVDCLKDKDALSLAVIEDQFTSRFPQYFLPSYVNEFLPFNPLDAIKDGKIAPIDVLLGNTKDEVSIFLNYMIPNLFKLYSEPQIDLETARNIIGILFQTVPNPPTSEILKQYFQNLNLNDTSEIVQTIIHAFGDYVFYCPVKFFAEKVRNAYVYWMTHRSTVELYADWVGVPHFYDVPYTFGQPIYDVDKYTPEDGKFSNSVIQMWTNFAKTGNPQGRNDSNWPQFTEDEPMAFELNLRQERSLIHPRADACEFWRQYLAPNLRS